ncbi:hypothetical protein FRC11_013710, partial [Ceratobasidium sp. 423]
MPGPGFRPPEAAYLKTLIPDWNKTKPRAGNPKGRKDAYKGRTEFISNLVRNFLIKFPDHDPSVSDPGPVTYTQAELNQLPE